MQRFHYFSFGYVLLASLIWFASFQGYWWALGGITFLFFLLLVWGAISLQSNMFLSTFCSIKTNHKVVALTFDDGPDDLTPALLDLLKKFNAKATFFCIGTKIEESPSIVERIDAEGHSLGNHSFYHQPYFPVLSVKNIREEIAATQMKLKEVTGKNNRYFRPPFGVSNPIIARALKAFSLFVVGWSIRSLDTSKTKEVALARILKKIKGGDVVLLHDTTPDILWIVEQLLVYLKKNSMRALSLDEFIALGHGR